jgi:hypothetical protein
MGRIFRFEEFNKIESAIFRLKSVEKTDEEICYTGTLSINGEKIVGQIFCEKNGDLECFQFYDKNGKDICDIYGQNIMESVIKEKLKRLKRKNNV